MHTPEASITELHRRRITGLREDGLIPFLSFTAGIDGAYGALIVPRQEHEEQWCEPVTNHATPRSVLFEPIVFFDEALLAPDPRFCKSDSLWQALTDAQETTTRIIDNAPPELYYSLESSPGELQREQITLIAMMIEKS